MMNDGLLVLSVFSLVVSLVIACIVFRKKYDIVHPLRIVGVGLVIADFLILLLLVPEAYGNCTNSKNFAWSTAVMEMAQMVTLNVAYHELLDAARQMQICGLLLYFFGLCLLTPIVWGGIVLTLFDGCKNLLKYWTYKHLRSAYFFSELHENSLALAKSIFEAKQKRCLCIFCGVGANTDSECVEEAKKHGFLLFKQAETENRFMLCGKHERFFFEISENQDENLAHTQQLITKYTEKYAQEAYQNVKVFCFSEQEEVAIAISSTDKKGLPVMILNRNRLIANMLLFEHPLYEVLSENEKTISVLVVGAGSVGKEILKTALSCGQLGSDYHLKLTVVDKQAEHLRSVFQLEMPEIFNGEYDISFVQCDVSEADFKNQLDKHCGRANYICVSCGNDEQNIRTALFLRSYYLQKDVANKEKPFIAVLVKNDIKNAAVQTFITKDKDRTEKHKEEKYYLTAFGGNASIYSYQGTDSALEKLALNVHYAYDLAYNSDATESYARKYFTVNEINTRSDRANALHIRYKLFLLGYDMKPLRDATESEKTESARLVEACIQKLQDADTLLRLSQIEHSRWNAFMRAEGWRQASIAQAEAAGTHKNIRAKLHVCLCDWDTLDEVSKKIKLKFKEYDEKLVTAIPVLIGAAADKTNISGTNYIITRR